MRFDFTEDHRLFRENLRAFLEDECTPESLRSLWATETGRSRELWAKLAEVGLLGVLVPEDHGGLGLGEVDLVLLLEEAGRVALPDPVVETAAVGAPLLRDSGSSLAAEWLPRIASGEAILAIAHPRSPVVSDAHVAGLIVVADESAIHAVPRDRVKLTAQPASDLSRRLFTIDAASTTSKDGLLASGADARKLLGAALDRGALAVAAQQLGLAQRMVEIAVAYARQREQFGKPIGSFQAVKHMLSSVQVKIEFARPLVYRAAHSVAHPESRGEAARGVDVSLANAAASEAALAAARTALQVHGAIGYTWEVDLHIWMKRAWALESAWGSASWHRRRVGAAVVDGDGPAPSFGFAANVRSSASSAS
ncbi:MAG: acyl-CoA dehydrogenase [Deltaproteobacteria bacterium]|nr:acyl-CoA dehydrogenase [Deltaproteobacteria bacterium]